MIERPPLQITEFARRLCAANHPLYSTTGPVPCGQHVQEAERLYALTQPVGTASYRVLAEARFEQVGPE